VTKETVDEIDEAARKKYDREMEKWVDANVAQQRACASLEALCDREKQMYHPSRLEFFVASALTGLLAGPDVAVSISVKAVEYAKAAIRQIDKE